MKYAIIYENGGGKYLIGFTNEPIIPDSDLCSKEYTIELKELKSLFIPLEGNAAMYLF